MRKPIRAIFWRRANKATVDTLTGRSQGQYDIRWSLDATSEFFEGIQQNEPTTLGGYTLAVPLQPFGGPNPVPARTIQVHFMGPSSERKDWYIRAQRPDTAYDLWRQGRGLPGDHEFANADRKYLLIIRDNEGLYHGRWANEATFDALPVPLKSRMKAEEVGILRASDPPMGRVAEIIRRLEANFNVLIYGPPGTGKTHIMKEVSKAFGTPTYFIDTDSETTPIAAERVLQTITGSVTFHQSYSYEDFIVGLRPEPGATFLNLTAVPGLLLELAEFARRPNSASLLVINEINRGNVSRIFGEFITLLEPDKRLNDLGQSTDTTMSLRLPYIRQGQPVQMAINGATATIQNPFTMPRRVYTLATMNSVDKSVAPLDSALRRRFDIVNLAPELNSMTQKMDLGTFDPFNAEIADPCVTVADIQKLALALLAFINKSIGFYLGTEFSLGQWYLAPLLNAGSTEAAKDSLVDIWNFKILPQLEDLFHGKVEQLETLLRLDSYSTPAESPVALERPPDEVAERGGTAFLRRQAVTYAQLEKYLRYLGKVGAPVLAPQPAPAAAEPAPQV